MLFRDELEESGMEKEEMDAAVAEHRAQLLAEAEKELASKAAQENPRAEKKARCVSCYCACGRLLRRGQTPAPTMAHHVTKLLQANPSQTKPQNFMHEQT